MELYRTSESYYHLKLTQEEAQVLFDITHYIGGIAKNTDGTTAPRGHIQKIKEEFKSQFNFETKHELSGSIYFKVNILQRLTI
jgi:hypothetical protein